MSNYKIEYVDPNTLQYRPDNRNFHPPEQIERLAKLIEYNGFRVPVIVSKLSGLVVAGHGRLDAAKQVGLKEVPVIYQDFQNEDEEWQFHIADNAIHAWANLDLSQINKDIQNFGPFDIDLLAIKDFLVDLNEAKLEEKQDQKRDELNHILEVHFNSESEMIEVYDELLSRGLIVKAR